MVMERHKQKPAEVAANSKDRIIDTAPSFAIAAASRIFRRKLKLQTTHFHQRLVGRPMRRTLFTFFITLLWNTTYFPFFSSQAIRAAQRNAIGPHPHVGGGSCLLQTTRATQRHDCIVFFTVFSNICGGLCWFSRWSDWAELGNCFVQSQWGHASLVF